MITLDDIYRDVYSQLNVDGTDHEIYSEDIIKAINQVIRSLRAHYVSQGLGGYFSVTETIFAFIDDFNYDFLKAGFLSTQIIRDVPTQIAVLASNVKLTDNELLDEEQTWSEGDVVEYDGNLYEALKDITDENTFGKVFHNKKLRMFYPDNGIKYKNNEIVWNPDEDTYYKVTQNFIAENGEEHLEEVYWRHIGTANTPANVYPMHLLRGIVQHDNERQAFAVAHDKVYVNDSVNQLTITYVPEWEDVTLMDEEVRIPEQLQLEVVQRSVNKLLRKVTQTPTPIQEEDEQQAE